MSDSKMSRRAVLKAGAALGGASALTAAAFAEEHEDAAGEAAMRQIEENLKRRIVELIDGAAEPLPAIDDPAFPAFIDRYADKRVILLGESTHGTDEFYRARARITECLVKEHGFTVVAVEADWPDAARIDAYVRGRTDLPSPIAPFQRFPAWMWRNRAVRDFVDRLHAINQAIEEPERKAGFYGLDLYSLPSSMDAVVGFVERYDPQASETVRKKYGCLAPWKDDPGTYGALARTPALDSCSQDVRSVLEDVLSERMHRIEANDAALFGALQNARVVAAAEAYYRAMHEGSAASWNLRDRHMFATLEAVLDARGNGARAVVWAHNSHIGNAAATGMGMMGEINIGQLARERFGENAVLIGFGTDRGTVTAASEWGGPAETKNVRPSLPESYGALLREAEADRFLLDFGSASAPLKAALQTPRLERFIGVIYRPETERLSHYSEASLPRQFDALLWFDETKAVEPLPAAEIEAMPKTYPFGL